MGHIGRCPIHSPILPRASHISHDVRNRPDFPSIAKLLVPLGIAACRCIAVRQVQASFTLKGRYVAQAMVVQLAKELANNGEITISEGGSEDELIY